jgi:hypothetical protein
MSKPKDTRPKLLNSENGWKKLQNTSRRLKFQNKLKPPQSKRLTKAKENSTKTGLHEKAQNQQCFLDKVLEKNPGYFLLCVITFSHNVLTYTKDAVLEGLLDILRNNTEDRNILHANFQSFVTKFRLSGAILRPQSEGPRLESRESEQGVISQPPDNTDEDVVYENPSIQGLARVFDDYVCGIIRRVTMDDDVRGAVTMVFPEWDPVDCLMSLAVGEQEAGLLVATLFSAEIKWVDNNLHVTYSTGTTQITPGPEATLKGVPDQAVMVFGTEIYNAINERPIRKRELEQGKFVAECVSMIITKNGATINLSLNFEGAVRIKNKLYN